MKYSLAIGPALYVNTNVYYKENLLVCMLYLLQISLPKYYKLSLLNVTKLEPPPHFQSTWYYVYPICLNGNTRNGLSFN